MTIEYGMKDGVLLWVRSPFDGTVTYFNDIHRKPHAFRHLTNPQHVAATPPPLAPRELQGETERVRNTCVFCPGNEAMTMEEVLRVTYGDIYDTPAVPSGFHADDWAIRVIRNIIPRVPEECTGGKNESYVIIEDGRHFLPGVTGLSDLMWSGALPAQHYYHVFRVAAEVVRRSLTNTAVKSVLIGRPLFWGLAVDGEAGVRAILEMLRDELDISMGMCGRATIASIDRSVLGTVSPLLSVLAPGHAAQIPHL